LYDKVALTPKSDGTMAAAFPSQQAPYLQPTKIEAVIPAIAPPLYAPLDDHDDGGPAVSWHLVSRLLCYDAGMTLYILVVIAWGIWQTTSVTAIIGLVGPNDDGGSCGSFKWWIVASTMLGWLYTMVVFCVFGCSFVCSR
jgi:hypothetical protein